MRRHYRQCLRSCRGVGTARCRERRLRSPSGTGNFLAVFYTAEIVEVLLGGQRVKADRKTIVARRYVARLDPFSQFHSANVS